MFCRDILPHGWRAISPSRSQSPNSDPCGALVTFGPFTLICHPFPAYWCSCHVWKWEGLGCLRLTRRYALFPDLSHPFRMSQTSQWWLSFWFHQSHKNISCVCCYFANVSCYLRKMEPNRITFGVIPCVLGTAVMGSGIILARASDPLILELQSYTLMFLFKIV